MKNQSSSLIKTSAAIFAAAAFLASNALAQVTLVNEDFSDGDHSNQNLPTSSEWMYSGPSAGISVSGGALTGVTDGSSRISLTYFTNAAPITLGAGDNIAVSFTLRFANGIAGTSTDALRLGLFNSFATSADSNASTTANRVEASSFFSTSASEFAENAGYFASLNPGGAAASTILRVYSRQGDNSAGNLLGNSGTGIDRLENSNGGSALSLLADEDYSVSFTVTRNATDVEVAFSMSGLFFDGASNVNDTQSITRTASSDLIDTFDTFALFTTSAFSSADNYALDNFQVTTSVPEPSTVGLFLGAAMVVILARRRRLNLHLK